MSGAKNEGKNYIVPKNKEFSLSAGIDFFAQDARHTTPCTQTRTGAACCKSMLTRPWISQTITKDPKFVRSYATIKAMGKNLNWRKTPCTLRRHFTPYKPFASCENCVTSCKVSTYLGADTSLENTLLRCINTLTEDHKVHEVIDNLLALIGEYYNADRTHLFELNDVTGMISNPHEWVAKPHSDTVNACYFMSKEELTAFSEAFATNGYYVIKDINTDLAPDSSLFQILSERKVHSLMLVPIFSQNKITSFIGVDNPQKAKDSVALLHSIGIFIQDNLKKLRLFKELESLNYTDTTTGLANRNKYRQRLEALDIEPLQSFGVMRIDVNGLKNINALYGEEYGNYVLLQTAKALDKYIPQDVFRIGNGEFIALFPNISQQNFETALAHIREHEAHIDEYSFAIGGIWQNSTINIAKAITDAGEIMYAEKQKYYTSLPVDHVQVRLNPAEIVLQEIREGLFFVYLQPKVRLENGHIIGAEALIRKKQKNGKMISPDQFVPVYEHDGTIWHVDFFVLEEVCKVLQTLIKQNCAVPIAVNFSRSTFVAYDLVDEIKKVCAKYAIPHALIKIEITESIDKMDIKFFENTLRTISAAGFALSLDDFGAKHSNLAMLTIPYFTEVKIDKILLDNMDLSTKNHTIVKYLINMIKEFKTSSCIVEGIETEKQRQELLSLGCEFGQGYYFYKPLSIENFLQEFGIHV